MNVSKLKTAGLFVAVAAISVATTLATSHLSRNSEMVYKTGENKIPASYAAFANASSALDTDFTVAAELSVHAVVHVKTKTPMRAQSFGGFSDPFFEYFFGPQQRRQQQPQETPMQEGSGSGVKAEDGFDPGLQGVLLDPSRILVHSYSYTTISRDGARFECTSRCTSKHLSTLPSACRRDEKVKFPVGEK